MGRTHLARIPRTFGRLNRTTRSRPAPGRPVPAAFAGSAEIEPERVDNNLCHSAGLHSGAYSFGYVAHGSAGEPRHIRQTADRIITTARALLHDSGITTEPAATPEPVAA